LRKAARSMSKIQTALGAARLIRTSRKTLAISVYPDGSLELVAPEEAKLEDILKKVVKRAGWIRRQQQDFAALNAGRMPRRYASGATHRYLGRQYRLKVTKGTEPCVRLIGGYFRVVTREGTEAEVRELLAGWMRERACEQFTRRVSQWRAWCERQGLPVPRMALREMAKRWGSAQPNGRIVLNPGLVRAPSVCIDYVVAHEICHLKHPNHGAEFLRLLARLMPDWQKVKRRLEEAEI
jgi:predicted metal-dependent hydrolase